MNRQKILIVDDSEMNREMLKAILGEGYKYTEAEDGAQALRMLRQDMNIDLMLLDINMPKVDGFTVLEYMNQFRWIDEIPVVMISAADDHESIERCYGLGVSDYIRRPFDSFIVQRRVKNTLTLYANQKRLMGMVSDQIYRNQRDNNVMIGILSHIVEFRNSESAQHVLQVQTVTGMLLRRLSEKTDVYHLTEEKIRLIVTASALHDIGKISIPESILNKPGRLTPEEFDVIRTHPAIGASMLEGLTPYRKEPLLKAAIEICRWHHERWDGGGYPDGLLGEQIPISAQVVALADVEEKIRLIVTASALHDIGKISIPESILNKPGRLTPEEFDVIRTHPAIGASMLEGLTPYRKEPLLKAAIEICRWHHERWDGGGYPDGLLGEQIPISAQVVALADVYDALTSDRCYKKAYSHETAITMILNGECGAFNPMLLDCLQEISARLKSSLPRLAAERSMKKNAQRLSSELLKKNELPRSDRAQRELNHAREMLTFFASCCGGVQFEYDTLSRSITVVDWSRPWRKSRTILDADNPDSMRLLRPADLERLRCALKATTPENNELSISLLLPVEGEQHWHSIRMHTLWSPLSPGSYVGVIGCMTDMQKEQDSRAPLGCADRSTANGPSLVAEIRRLGTVFDIVRLVDPSANAVLEIDANGSLHRTGERCTAFWDSDSGCANCISTRAFAERTTLNKLEFTRNEMYFVIAKYVSVNGTPCVLEMISRLNEGRWIDANGSRFLLDRTRGEDMQLFLDPMTGVYSRRYFETYRTHLEGMEGVALIDVNSFKRINDTCGHAAGDAALRDIAGAIRSCIRKTDILIRYGGDEFLLLFPRMTEEIFLAKKKQIQQAVRSIRMSEFADIRLSVSVGGVCGVHPITEAIRKADCLMYLDKAEQQP